MTCRTGQPRAFYLGMVRPRGNVFLARRGGVRIVRFEPRRVHRGFPLLPVPACGPPRGVAGRVRDCPSKRKKRLPTPLPVTMSPALASFQTTEDAFRQQAHGLSSPMSEDRQWHWHRGCDCRSHQGSCREEAMYRSGQCGRRARKAFPFVVLRECVARSLGIGAGATRCA